MQVRFGYCNGVSSLKIQRACENAISGITGKAEMPQSQYKPLEARLKKIETAVTTIAERLNVQV